MYGLELFSSGSLFRTKRSAPTMNLIEIANHRFIHQHLADSKFTTAKELVSWMGALQAQDFQMSKMAVGLRVKNATEKSIESAMHAGEIIRMHLLRPTWHLVTAEDVTWMLALSATHIQSAMRARDRELELTTSVFNKSNAILENSLRDGNHLSRQELIIKLKDAGIAVDNNRASHLLMHAESEAIICSGKFIANQLSYAILSERVPLKKKFEQEEALAELANRYFTSHGPATLADFTWWSGLSVSKSRIGLEMVRKELEFIALDGKTYWFRGVSIPKIDSELVHLLPAYDEFIISYTDRNASLGKEINSKAVSTNGLFRPVLVQNGRVIGTWKRESLKEKIRITTHLFADTNQNLEQKISLALKHYAYFLNKQIEQGAFPV